MIPFGLDDEIFIQLLADNIGIAVRETGIDSSNSPSRLWLVAGSGTILLALAKLWPQTHFLILQVGKEIYPDILERVPHKTLYVSNIPFYQETNDPPPYPSIGKLWTYVKRYGQEGDVVWNVAA
jgi:hypothetical protein